MDIVKIKPTDDRSFGNILRDLAEASIDHSSVDVVNLWQKMREHPTFKDFSDAIGQHDDSLANSFEKWSYTKNYVIGLHSLEDFLLDTSVTHSWKTHGRLLGYIQTPWSDLT
jgi:hypothetical protein